MATGDTTSSIFGALTGATTGTTMGASVAADRVASQAGGYASSAAQSVGDIFGAALDEYHAQEDRAETWLRWGTVAFALLVLLVMVVVGAYFLAPVRKLIAP